MSVKVCTVTWGMCFFFRSLLWFVILLVRSFFTCLHALDMFVALRLCDVMCSNLFFFFPLGVCVLILCRVIPVSRNKFCLSFTVDCSHSTRPLVLAISCLSICNCQSYLLPSSSSSSFSHWHRVREHLSFYTHSWYLTPMNLYTVHAVDVTIDLRRLMSAR